jgi:hypothetical protein
MNIEKEKAVEIMNSALVQRTQRDGISGFWFLFRNCSIVTSRTVPERPSISYIRVAGNSPTLTRARPNH